jgi:nucleoid DNA-binding protein
MRLLASARSPIRKEAHVTKSDLVDAIAERAGMTKRDAHAALDATLAAISDELAHGGAVTLTGFGTFKVSARAARRGVNPRTGAPVQIAAARVPRYSAGASLKSAVNTAVRA